MREEFKELIELEDNMKNISNKFVSIGYSDMFEVGNIDECIENNNCVAISIYNEETKEHDEINVEFEIVEMCNKEEYENNLDTLVKITDIYDI